MTGLMKSIFIVLLSFCFVSLGSAAKIGAASEGGIYLFKERVERYWNDWRAYPLRSKRTMQEGQPELAIRGVGKTASFIGFLSINCENGKFYWRAAANFHKTIVKEKEIAEAVPTQVISNATKLFCRRK